MLLLVVKAGARERKAIRKRMEETHESVEETRDGLKDAGEKINALIDAQMRHEEVYAQSKQRTEEEMERLTRAQAEAAESLKALIDTVDRMAKERGNGQV